MTDFSALAISGTIATPSDADWDEARAAWNLAADQRPAAVAIVENADDVAAVARFAAENRLNIAGQGTGHGAGPLAPALDGAILVKTHKLRGIEIDPETETARVEAGVISAELGKAANEHGLISMPGSSPDVGVVGFTLGGGLSWFGRRHGFACNRVTAIDLVTAAGEPKTVDAENDPDLFWALRGGGGGYALVTALHVKLLPIAEAYGGILIFPAEVGADAVRAYRDWAAEAPEEFTSVIRFITPPPIPDVPEPLRGKPLLTIDGAFIGGKEEGDALLAPLRAIGEPIMDSFGPMPTAGLSHIHMDPENPVPGEGDGMTLRELSDEAVDAWVGVAGVDSGSPLLLSELRHIGGALGREDENGGALSKLDAGWAIYSVGILMTPELGEAISAHLNRIEETMEPWGADGAYYNFSDRPKHVDYILPAEVCERLREVKAKWDPDHRVIANHALELTG
jgi:FAD/FMN-containing dehydrogenase